MNLRQKRDLRRLTRQITQIIFFLWMPALYTSAFSGVRYVIEQIRADTRQNEIIQALGSNFNSVYYVDVDHDKVYVYKADRAECISCNADRIMWIYHFIWQILLRICLCIWNLGGWNVCPIPMDSEKSKKEASVGIRRNRTETSKNEIYSVISLNADLCIRIYEKVSWN